MNVTAQSAPSTLVLISQEALNEIKETLQEIKASVKFQTQPKAIESYITAQEFMDACRIGRTKFDELRAENKIKVIQKGRKIYLLASEVESYFRAA